MTDLCVRAEELEAVLDLPAADPRRRHLSSCPRCRSLLLEYREFLTVHPEEEGPALEAANAHLSEVLREAMAGAAAESGAATPARAGLEEKSGRAFGLPWPRLAGPAIAIAAMMLVVFGMQQFRSEPTPREIVLRGEGGEERWRVEAAEALPAGGVLLRWRTLTGADHYRVHLFDVGVQEIAHFEGAPGDTLLLLSAAQIADLPPAEVYAWQVAAFSEGDLIRMSEPGSFRPGGESPPPEPAP